MTAGTVVAVAGAHMLKPLLLLPFLVPACVSAADDSLDDTEAETASELTLVSPPPPNGPRVTRVSTAELDAQMGLLLGGPLVTVDTTGTSATKLGPLTTVCTYPNQAQRDAAQAECRADYSGSELFACLQQVNIDYPNISECHDTRFAMHSYLDFNALAESRNIQDVTFPFDPIWRDTTGPGGVTIDVNYVRTNGPPTAAFTGNALNIPSARIAFPLISNSPTLPCTHSESYLGCPDIELWNMKVTVTAPSLQPGGAKLAFGPIATSFTFDRNFSGVPDWLITAFLDVDAVLRSVVEGKVTAALNSDAGRAAIADAFTTLAINAARVQHPTLHGFSQITHTWYDPAGQALVVEYDWY
jgi:hypothetical protein